MRRPFVALAAILLLLVSAPLFVLADVATRSFESEALHRRMSYRVILPRDYTAAVAKFGKAKITENGTVPWRTEEYYGNLRRAFEAYGKRPSRIGACTTPHTPSGISEIPTKFQRSTRPIRCLHSQLTLKAS